MASAYADTIDIYREDSFRQKVVDWHKTIRFDIDGNRPNEDTTMVKALNLKNAIPWTARMVVKGKLVADDGAASPYTDLAAGRYKLEHGASIWRSARLILNSEELEHCRDPAVTATVSALVRKSAVQVDRDAPKNAFFPLRHSRNGLYASSIEVAKTTPHLTPELISMEDSKYPDTFTLVTAGAANKTISITTAGALTAAGADPIVFTAADVGRVIHIPSINYAGVITAFTDGASVTISPAPSAAVAGSTAWQLIEVNSQPFRQGSMNGVVSSTNASGEFYYTVDLKDIFGSLNTDKMLPFASLEFIFEKQNDWARAIHRSGADSVNARFIVSEQFLLIDTIKPRDDAFVADMKKMSEGVPMPMRFLKYGYEFINGIENTNVNISLLVAGKRIKDLWVIPQVQAYNESQLRPSLMTGEQDMDHKLAASPGGWSNVALHIGDSTFPRHKSYRGYNEGYLPEYEALRRSADLGESEGGSFITYEKYRNGYNWLYFDLSERTDEETLSIDHAPRLEITYAQSAIRNFHVVYTFEVAHEYKATESKMEKVSNYVL